MLKTNEVFFFDSDEFELIISHYLDIGELNLAKKAAKIARSQHPHAIELKLLEVEIFIFDNKLKQAEEILNDLQDLAFSNPDIYIYKANILSKRDAHEKAIESLKKARELIDDDDSEVHSLIAMEYMFLENYEEAKNHFVICLRNEPDDFASLFNIIYCFDNLEKAEEAIHFLEQYLDEFPYSEIGWHQLGLQYLNLKNREKAIECFDYSIISDDTFIGAYIEKGKTLEKLSQYNEAIECYNAALELEDSGAFVYFHLGKCYEKNNDDKQALKYYNKALQEDPASDKTWSALTDFFIEKEQYQKALSFIEKAISIDESNVEYWKRYIEINRRLGQKDKAENGLIKSMELGYYNFEACITRCDLLIGMNNFETALQVMEEAQKIYPDFTEIEYRLGGLYLHLNRKKEGLERLQKGLDLDKEYAVVLHELFPHIFELKAVQDLLVKNKLFL